MNLGNMVSERNQIQKVTYHMFPFLSRICISIEAGNKFVIAQGWSGLKAGRNSSIWGVENVLKIDCSDVAQLYEYTKNH